MCARCGPLPLALPLPLPLALAAHDVPASPTSSAGSPPLSSATCAEDTFALYFTASSASVGRAAGADDIGEADAPRMYHPYAAVAEPSGSSGSGSARRQTWPSLLFPDSDCFVLPPASTNFLDLDADMGPPLSACSGPLESFEALFPDEQPRARHSLSSLRRSLSMGGGSRTPSPKLRSVSFVHLEEDDWPRHRPHLHLHAHARRSAPSHPAHPHRPSPVSVPASADASPSSTTFAALPLVPSLDRAMATHGPPLGRGDLPLVVRFEGDNEAVVAAVGAGGASPGAPGATGVAGPSARHDTNHADEPDVPDDDNGCSGRVGPVVGVSTAAAVSASAGAAAAVAAAVAVQNHLARAARGQVPGYSKGEHEHENEHEHKHKHESERTQNRYIAKDDSSPTLSPVDLVHSIPTVEATPTTTPLDNVEEKAIPTTAAAPAPDPAPPAPITLPPPPSSPAVPSPGESRDTSLAASPHSSPNLPDLATPPVDDLAVPHLGAAAAAVALTPTLNDAMSTLHDTAPARLGPLPKPPSSGKHSPRPSPDPSPKPPFLPLSPSPPSYLSRQQEPPSDAPSPSYRSRSSAGTHAQSSAQTSLFTSYHMLHGSESDSDAVDPNPPSPRGRVPPQEHPFHPRVVSPPPALPLPRKPSIRSPPFTVVADAQSPPDDQPQFDQSRRASRYSQVSSNSSDYLDSATTPRYNTASALWTLPERPTPVSTVLEEEPHQGQSEWHDEKPAGDSRRESTWTTASTTRGDNVSIKSASERGTDRGPPPAFGQGPASRRRPHTAPTTSQRTRPERSSTVSSSTSGHSKKSAGAHPFAALNRAPSPRLATEGPEHLSPTPAAAPGLPATGRSVPSLYESFKMAAAATPAHQVTLVSTEDEHGEEECPICCESLSFTYRLPGEKPHVVPECGHSLHEECFVTVYGRVLPSGSSRNIGVCGVCRQPMRVSGTGGERSMGKNKLAALMGGENGSGMGLSTGRPMSVHGAENADGNGDDGVEPIQQQGAGLPTRLQDQHVKVVIPRISILSEYASVRRVPSGKQMVTAMVSIDIPPAVDRSKYAARNRKESFNLSSSAASTAPPITPPLPSPPSAGSFHDAITGHNPSGPLSPNLPNPFAHVVADLRRRLENYKNHGIDTLGPLRLFDILKVRKGTFQKDFHIYLFQEALICVSEERKSGLRNMFHGSSKSNGDNSNRTVLKLRGRIFLRHVHHVVDASTKKELSIALTMETEQEGIDSFMLSFSDRSSHEMWKSTVTRLVDEANNPVPAAHTATGGAGKVAKLMGPPPPGVRAPTINSAGNLSPAPIAASIHEDIPACPITCLGDLAYHVPLARQHTPVDLVIALSTPSHPTPITGGGTSGLPLKARLMRTALQFVLSCMGPKDRVAFVATELGAQGVVRKTPLLNATHHDSRKRLEGFIDGLGIGKIDDDEFEVEIGKDERPDVVTAVNVALDVILQRKVKNPLCGFVLISDTAEQIKRSQMDLVTARLDAAKVPVHTFGYGKAHDPSPLWMISNHTHGTYTFVKEWYHLRDALAGAVGGIMSIALTSMKLRLTCQDNDFRVTKVSGTSQAVISTSGKDVDIDLHEVRHGERREILVEMELDCGPVGEGGEEQGDDGVSLNRHQSMISSGGSLRSRPSLNVHGINGLGGALDALSMSDPSVIQGVVSRSTYPEGVVEEVPVVEVDCSFHDPLAGRSAARLAHPVLLALPVLPPSAAPSTASSEPSIVRRRMELLASDMITRALLIASRKNFGHATRILRETKRIIETIADSTRQNMPNPAEARSRFEIATVLAVDGLASTIQDVDMFLDGLEVSKEMFEMDHRNYAAQQAVILRTQQSWTNRTPTELHYATQDVKDLIQASSDYSPRT
ncbi:hypothetical protein Q8F55_007062 [Vanrija albida]|uniref:RING-type domain-containing protein n=1 Tax=Vanrija albida TaxID=181172 RepID=A0ABR3PYU3_9TREE